MNKFNSLNASQRQLGATISNTTVRKSAGQYGYVLEVTVDPDESRRLGERLRSMSLDKVLPQFEKDPDEFEKTAVRLLRIASPIIHAKLTTAARQAFTLPSLFVIRGFNMAVGTLPPTPIDGQVNDIEVPINLVLLAATYRIFGHRGIAFASENGGRMLRAVAPVKRHSMESNSQGAAADLGSHTDNPSFPMVELLDHHISKLPFSNSAQFFSTVRPKPTVPMRVRLLDDVLARLDPNGGDFRLLTQFETLLSPCARLSLPPSFGGLSFQVGPLPVLLPLSKQDGRYAIRYHSEHIEPVSGEAAAAIQLLRDAIERTPEEVILTEPGDIVGYSNRSVLHRREPFDANYDGDDRYYIRCYTHEANVVEHWRPVMGPNGRVMG